jgi:hypothetical protein
MEANEAAVCFLRRAACNMSDKNPRSPPSPKSPSHDCAVTTQSPAEELDRLLERKEQIEQQLQNLERQIYALETSYLEDTYNVGSLLKVRPP